MKFRKTLKVLAASALLFGTVGLATACGNNGTTDIKGLIINEDAKVIRGDFNLVDKYLGCDLTWTSSNENVAKITKGEGTYKVTISRPDKDTDVTLTATSGKYTKEFKISVPAIDASEIASDYTFAYNKKSLATGSYDLDSSYAFSGKTASIAWTVPEDASAVASISEGKLVIKGTKDKIAVVLTAVFSYNGTTSTKKYTVYAYDDPVSNDVVTKVEVGVPYILHMAQETLGKDLYFSGAMSGYYGATSEDKSKAVQIVFEQATDGYYITFTDANGSKLYINITVSGTHVNFSIGEKASTVWTWNAEYNTPVTVVDGKTYYIGSYKTYSTISPATIDKAASSYPLHLTPVTDTVTTPEAGVKYDFFMATETPLYFAGSMKGYYGACTTKLSESVPLSLTAVDGGYHVSFTDSKSKTQYVNIKVNGTHINFTFAETASTVWTWNTEYNTLTTAEGYIVGTQGTFGTIGGYKLSDIKDKGNINPLQFKRHYDNIIIGAENTPDVKLAENAALFAASYANGATITLTKGVTAAIKEGTTASSVTIANGVVTIAPTTTEEAVTLVLSVDGKTREITFTTKKAKAEAGEFTSEFIKSLEGVNIEYGDVSSHFSNVPGAVAGIVVNQGSSATAPRIDSHTFRVYKGSEMIITAAEGFKFTACSFDFGEDKGTVYNGAEIQISEDGKKITITCPTEKHFRITAIHLTVVAE